MKKRFCPECNARVVGRSDKVFCSDHCRNIRNNRLNKDVNNSMRNINNALRKNRRILMDHCPGKSAKVTRKQLFHHGFHFKYLTHAEYLNGGERIEFCYDMGFKWVNEQELLIIKKANLV